MTSAATQNELEKLDMLLTKLDAVRYALPEVLGFFTSSASGPAGISNPQDRIQDYRYRVQKAERSLQDLQHSSSSLAGSLSNLLSQAEHLKLDQNKLQRLRKNPYSGRQIQSSSGSPKKSYKISFPASDEEQPIRTLEDLNATLETLVAKHPALKVLQNCQKWNPRCIVIELDNVARFHVFMTWTDKSAVKFQRINVVSVDEKKQSFQISDYTLWQGISIYATQAMSRHGQKDRLDLSCLIALINAYQYVQEQPCNTCHRLLHKDTLQLPTLRAYQSSDPAAVTGEWLPYHAECYVSSDNELAADP